MGSISQSLLAWLPKTVIRVSLLSWLSCVKSDRYIVIWLSRARHMGWLRLDQEDLRKASSSYWMNEEPADAVSCGFFLVVFVWLLIPVQEKAIALPSSTRPGTTANYGLGEVRSLLSNTNKVAFSWRWVRFYQQDPSFSTTPCLLALILNWSSLWLAYHLVGLPRFYCWILLTSESGICCKPTKPGKQRLDGPTSS